MKSRFVQVVECSRGNELMLLVKLLNLSSKVATFHANRKVMRVLIKT